MRSRRYQPLLEACRDRERLQRIVHASTLIAARLEPGILQQGGACGFDAIFLRDGEAAVVSGGLLDGPMVAEPEASPFVWPATAATLDDAVTDAVEALLLPWLLSNMLGRRCNDELVRTFGADDSLFARARALGFLGAAPYARVYESLAPYVLAARYARGRRIGIRGAPDAGAGAVLLARTARYVRADLGGDVANAAARQWYGLDIFGPLESDGYDVAVGTVETACDAPRRIVVGEGDGTRVTVARSIPFDVGVSFEPEDSERACVISVSAPMPRLRESSIASAPPASGGSSGRVLFAMRSDAERAHDADTDDAFELARRLRAEGFTVDVRCGASDPSGYDLVHAFTLPAIANWWETVDIAHRQGIPVVVTANADDLAAEGVWGAGMSVTLQSVDVDVASGEERRALFAARKLESAGLALPRQDPFPEYATRVRRALERAQATIVRDAREERLLRDEFGSGGPFVVAPPLLPVGVVPEWPAVVGDGEFVFAHAPIERRGNLLGLTRAAMQAKLPLVIAGPAVDVGYLAALRYMADEHVCVMTNVSANELEALYRRARVYADVGWYSFGPARQARAAASGCSLVLARNAYAAPLLAPGLWTADPADENAIAIALGDAWLNAGEPSVLACSRRAADWAEPGRAFVGVTAAYARAVANISATVAENV